MDGEGGSEPKLIPVLKFLELIDSIFLKECLSSSKIPDGCVCQYINKSYKPATLQTDIWETDIDTFLNIAIIKL